MRLRHKDWKKLFVAVAKLNSEFDPATLSDRAVAAANDLVSSEITAFDFFDGKGTHTGENWYDPPGSISGAAYKIFAHLVHEHPFSPDVFGKGRRDTMTTNDFLSPAQFRETAIFNEFFSLFPVHHQLTVALSTEADLIVTCTVNRKSRGFSDEERLMFDLVAPHLTNAIRNGRRIQKLLTSEANLNSAMEAKSSGVLALGADQKVEYASQYARSLVEKYFGHRKLQGEHLPNELESWVKRQNQCDHDVLDTANSKFGLELGDSILSISLIPNGKTNESVLILEESRKASPLNLVRLSLTNRQTEVLFWISQGKTDQDIAFLLGISPRTVHKHTESIYTKLGVETRTAAMSIAISQF